MMIKNIKTVFYYGEFGYFNFTILGHLEEYFNKNDKILVIRTYDDYFRILNFKFPGRFKKPDKPINVSGRDKRIYHRIQNDKFNQSLIESGWIPLEEMLKCNVKDWKDARNKIKETTSPLIASNSQKKKYISLLCRNRSIDLDRNLSKNTWEKIIKDVKATFQDAELVFHGLKEETSIIENYVFCSDIIESIQYLNESIIFLSSMSGFAQFASNCACSILQIGPSFQMIPYNPFQKTNLQIERTDIDTIGNYLKQQSL